MGRLGLGLSSPSSKDHALARLGRHIVGDKHDIYLIWSEAVVSYKRGNKQGRETNIEKLLHGRRLIMCCDEERMTGVARALERQTERRVLRAKRDEKPGRRAATQNRIDVIYLHERGIGCISILVRQCMYITPSGKTSRHHGWRRASNEALPLVGDRHIAPSTKVPAGRGLAGPSGSTYTCVPQKLLSVG